MALVSDNYQNKKLKEYGINIKTKYIVDHKILERNTDGSINDDITSGIRNEKEYYINNKLIHKEKNFDTRIEYTFISKKMENEKFKCPNCGMESKVKDFENGCPYCRTYYNIDYTDKDLGSKYHYDRVLKSNKYRIITGIIDILISLTMSYFYIKGTSRSFNSIDVTKIFIYGMILSAILYYAFYLLDAYIILGPIKRYKDKQNQKQIDFWNRTKIDKKSFFNNFNYEVRKYYYSNYDIIDFDIIDYIQFDEYKKNNELYVKVKAVIRIVTYKSYKIKSQIIKEEFIFKKNPTTKLELKDGTNLIKCHNCGSSIDANSSKCNYCHSEIKYLQDWILQK